MPEHDRTPGDKALTSAGELTAKVAELTRIGELDRAIQVADQLTRAYPRHGEGWHAASHLAVALNNADAALQSIDRALATAPDNIQWQLQKISCLLRFGPTQQAKELATKLGQSDLDSADHCAALGLLFSQLGAMPEALEQYQRAAVRQPGDPGNHYNLATVQRALGDFEAAAANLARAIELNPQDYDAWYAQSELKKQSPDSNNIAELEALLDSGISSPKAKVQILYALAKELEDIGDSQRSFAYLQSGATLRRQHLNYRPEKDIETMAQLERAYASSTFNEAIEGCPNREPIFILGLPRTGSTLLERILSSHSQVTSAGELENFSRLLVQNIRSSGLVNVTNGAPDLPAISRGINFYQLGEAYINSTWPQTRHSRHFIDKMPLNFLYTGLIHLALPNAKIVHIRRNPLDSCYAIYKTLFLNTYPFSYDLLELGHYYLAYRRLMDHWKSCLPFVLHEVSYEQLVDDLEGETRQLLEYCGLPWEPECMQFHLNSAASTTASAAQVRQPIYKSSVGRWRQYRDQLAPLIKLLESAGINPELD